MEGLHNVFLTEGVSQKGLDVLFSTCKSNWGGEGQMGRGGRRGGERIKDEERRREERLEERSIKRRRIAERSRIVRGGDGVRNIESNDKIEEQ